MPGAGSKNSVVERLMAKKNLRTDRKDDFIKILVYKFILVSLFIDFLKSIC